MRSLRVHLLVGTALGTTVVLMASSAALYSLIADTLWTEFDDALAAKARSLTALAEQGVEGLEFDLVEASLPEFEPSPQAEYYEIWRSDGTVFARSPSLGDGHLPRLTGTFETPALQKAALPDGRPGRLVGLTFAPRQEPEYDRAAPLQTTLVLGRDVVGLTAALARVRNLLMTVCLVAVAVSAVWLAWVVHRSLKPVTQLGGQIAGVGERDLSARIDAARVPKEMSPVVDRLNDLLARLEAAFQRERRFTGDVAHELRTPLAGLRSQLELALGRDRAAGEYQKTMRECLGISLQMQRIVENLLHLARADAGQLDVRREPVDLPEIIRNCWRPLGAKAKARGLTVDWHLDSQGAIETDRDMLRLVLKNVLDNAISYTNDDGSISISTSGEDGVVTISIANSGSSLPADDVNRVFDRFWRADSSFRPDHEAHCGLGLPLCRAVLEELGGSIEATASAAGIFTITIQLPATVIRSASAADAAVGLAR